MLGSTALWLCVLFIGSGTGGSALLSPLMLNILIFSDLSVNNNKTQMLIDEY